jgi:hypothetical protein
MYSNYLKINKLIEVHVYNMMPLFNNLQKVDNDISLKLYFDVNN